MSKCKKCGKEGRFLILDPQGFCMDCAKRTPEELAELREKIRERDEVEQIQAQNAPPAKKLGCGAYILILIGVFLLLLVPPLIQNNTPAARAGNTSYSMTREIIQELLPGSVFNRDNIEIIGAGTGPRCKVEGVFEYEGVNVEFACIVEFYDEEYRNGTIVFLQIEDIRLIDD